MQVDLTKGKIFPTFVVFTIPIILGNVLQQLYSVVDSIIIGKFDSVNALASIGATASINYLFIGFIFGLTGGFAIIISQEHGAKNEHRMRQAIAMGSLIAFSFSIVLPIFVILFLKQILMLMNTPQDIIQGSYDYLFIIFLGLPANLAYNFQSSILRSIGDSKTPLYLLLASCIFNIIGDLVFVLCFDMGVRGVAIATLLSNVLVAVACFIYTYKKYPILRLKKEDFKIDKALIVELMNLGLPLALQSSISAFGTTFLQISVNKMGPIAVAGLSIGNRVEGILSLLLAAAGVTTSTFVAQNYGAKQYERIGEGIKVMKRFIWVWAIACILIVTFFHDFLASIFINKNETETIYRASQYMFCIVIFYIPGGLAAIYKATLQGIGNGYISMLSSVQELIVRFAGALILPPLFGFVGACLSGSFSWFTSYIFVAICYRHIMKHENLYKFKKRI